MPIDLAAPFERLMNACNDKDFSWWPLVRCRPLSTERLGRRAVVAMGAVTLAWGIGVIVASPFVLLGYWIATGYYAPVITLGDLIAAARWLQWSGLLDAIVCAAAIGVPLCLVWSTWAWNRRARRLSRAVEASIENVVDVEGVWPPAPR